MKRVVRCVVVYGVIGVFINVAVAWACALWSPAGEQRTDVYHQSTPPRPPVPIPAAWPKAGDRGNAYFFHAWAGFAGMGIDVLTLRVLGSSPSGAYAKDEPIRHLAILESGWPMRSFRTRLMVETSPPMETLTLMPANWVYAVQMPAWIKPAAFIHPNANWAASKVIQYRVLPLEPIWTGQVLGAALYAGVLFIVNRMIARMRGFIRVRRGRCGACGYPASPSGVCSECGGTIRVSGGAKRGAHGGERAA